MALGLSTIHVIGDRLQGCNVTLPTAVAYWVDVALVVIPAMGAAAAGWWGSQGARARNGCLAGLVYGLMVAAGLVAADIVDFGLVECFVASHLPGFLRPQVTSIMVQGIVSSALEMAGLAALAGLVAGMLRARRQS